ncbi:MAG: efflux RND transporter permease subunit [Bacteroidetes bacterium]|nr:efflux RND transporter permease subunit [Bacteroidota bacterium]MBX7046283.1 efflux RND transporter permease subunit [Ignavibacteria bacterium]
MTLTELSIKRPSFIVVIFAVIAIVGGFLFGQLKYELLPKIASPVVVVSTVYPGASPFEVETSVTKVIEDAVSGIDKINKITASSLEGVSFVTIEFIQSAKIDIALQDVQRKVNEVVIRLPDDAKTPTLSKIALDEIPVLRMGVTSNMPPRDFYQLMKDQVQPRLAKLPGVGQIGLVGGDEREIKVNLDLDKIQSFGLSVQRIVGTIKGGNIDFPTGNLKGDERQYVVRVAGKVKSMEEMKSLIVGKSKMGGDVKLGDIAEVEDGTADYSKISRLNGITSIGVLVSKQTDANSVDVSALVRAEIPKIEKDYAKDNLKFDIAQDGSTFTLDAADAVKKDLGLAIVLVALVMLVFLHSIRNSIIVMIAIPCSMLATFIFMYIFGLSLNLMTLLGLSLVVGILVDDSIVVLENIYHHLEKGEEKRTAALKGRNEIGFAALSITLVDVVVFVPLTLVTGLIGNILREFSLVVVASTLMSLFVSFTVTPMLASRFSKLQDITKKGFMNSFSRVFERIYDKIKHHYEGLLRFSLRHQWLTIIVTGLLFFASFSLVGLGFIGGEFITQSDRGEFTVTLELDPGSTLENTNYVTRKVENIIGQMPEVKKMFVNVGASAEGLFSQASNNAAEINVTLVPKEQRILSTDQVGNEIKKKLENLAGAKVRVNPIGIFGVANQTPIQIIVSGPNMDVVKHSADTVFNILKRIPGTADVRLSTEDGKPETRVEIDREKLAAFGLSIAEVGTALRVGLSGDDDSKFRDDKNNTEYTIRVEYDKFDKTKISDLTSMIFFTPTGKAVQLNQFAKIYQTTGPTKLTRKDRNPTIYVYAQVNGRPSGSIGADFQTALKTAGLPPEIVIGYDGDLRNQAEGFSSLGIALLAAIIFMYLIMVALYDSYLYPFVVMFSLPVAVIGALLALALTMKTLNIFSILGMIMLMGLVAKNAILLVDRANDMKQHGLNSLEAILEAGGTRLRPILMTTIAMVIGMLPIALSHDSGSEWKSGLAWAIIGGLTSSMFLTLVVVPVIFVKFDKWKDWVINFRARRAAKREAKEALASTQQF